MSFEDIPEDAMESYTCPECHSGSVEQNFVSGTWECDQCDYSADDDS
ncbi:MAG: hypothetical protein ACN2B6_00055 [Rickettsiales bacterium]